MKKFYVYIHTCPNEKKYVGLTTAEPKKRWGLNGAKYKSNKHFYRAIQNFGWDNIDHQVFEVDTKEEMFFLEKYFISYYQTNKNEFGYNKSSGGENGGVGCHRSEETKRKMSEANKGRISNRKGKHHSEESKKKISESQKGNQYHKGKPHSEETKKKISEVKKGCIPWNKGVHLESPMKGKHHSEEAKKKISETLKRRNAIKKELV